MPLEYYLWLENLHARDTLALGAAALAGVFYLAAPRFRLPDRVRRIIHKVSHLPHPSSLIPHPSSRPTSYALRTTHYILPSLIILGLILRLTHLGAQSLWFDEALTALTAQRSVGDILTIAKHSNHPPGYYLLIWAWSNLWWSSHPPEWQLRLPSALLGTGNIGLIYLVARRFNRPRSESLLAAGLMAALPFQLFYGQEARMYTLLLAAGQITLLGYLARRWGLVVIGATVMMYSQSMGAMFLAALAVVAMFDGRFKPLLLAGGVTAALYAPWVGWGLVNQINLTANGWIPQATPGSFAYLWRVLLWGETNPAWIVIPGMILAGVIVIAAVVAGLRSRLYGLVGLALGPPLLAVVASLVVAPVFIPRPLITATPALYILIAHTLRAGRRWLLAGLLAVMTAISLHGYYTNPDLQKWPYREWAAEIRQRYQPGDAVFYVSPFLPFWWYLPDLPTCFLSRQGETAPNAGFTLSPTASAALGMQLVEPDYLDRYRRVFVLYARSPATTPKAERVYRNILAHKPVIWQREFVNDNKMAIGSISLVAWSERYDPTSLNICNRSNPWDLLTQLKRFLVSANLMPRPWKPIVTPRP